MSAHQPPEDDFKAKLDAGLWGKLIRRAFQKKAMIYPLIVTGVLIAACDVGFALVTRWVIDGVVRDGGVRGVVIRFGSPFRQVKAQGTRVTAGAGCIDAQVAKAAANAPRADASTVMLARPANAHAQSATSQPAEFRARIATAPPSSPQAAAKRAAARAAAAPTSP